MRAQFDCPKERERDQFAFANPHLMNVGVGFVGTSRRCAILDGS
jgi:hypothetical protein